MAYKCPRDPKKKYFNHHCKERQRTPWMKAAACGDCHHFKQDKEVDDETNSN